MRYALVIGSALMSLGAHPALQGGTPLEAWTQEPRFQSLAVEDWDWTEDVPQTLYCSRSGERPTLLDHVRLPFFTSGNVLCQHEPDMRREDGWVLAFRDFGSPEAAPPFPYFALYNRYRGSFRLMLYNAVNVAYTSFCADGCFLKGRDPQEHAAALMTFSSRDACFLSDYGADKHEVETCHACSFGDWLVFDFPMVGYDPGARNKDIIFQVGISGVDTSDIHAKGKGDISLHQVRDEQIAPGASALDERKVAEAVKEGYAWFKSTSSWVKNEATNPKNSGAWWWGIAQGLASKALMSYAPWAAGLAGIVSAFIGGDAFASPREFLDFSGKVTFDLDGYMETRRGLWAVNFCMNRKSHPPRTAQPQPPKEQCDLEWGVFNFLEPNAVHVHVDVYPVQPWPLDCWVNYRTLRFRAENDPRPIINPLCGMTLESHEIAFNFPRTPPTPFVSYEKFIDEGCCTENLNIPPEVIGVTHLMKFRADRPTCHASQVITVQKTYPVRVTYSTVTHPETRTSPENPCPFEAPLCPMYGQGTFNASEGLRQLLRPSALP